MTERREDERIPYRTAELSGERVLVLSAHPDDETLGAGGTIVLNTRRGAAVRIWIATDGERQEGSSDDAGYGGRRREEARLAAATLGAAAPIFAGLPDRSLDSSPDALARAIGEQVSEFEPDLVLCPSPAEIHPDHRALSDALYRAVGASRPEDPDHDRYRFLRLGFYEISQPFLPNTLVDIADVANRKDKALDAYASQQTVRDYAGALRGLNAYRRLTLSGAGPVEAFCVLRWPEVSGRSLEEFRRAIGPAVVEDGSRGPAPVAVVVRTWPHFQPAFRWSSVPPLAVLAVIANLCYGAAYVVELAVSDSPARPAWRRQRWGLWLAGTLVAMLIEYYWIVDEIYPDVPFSG